jgi:hypothetical protein
LGPNPSRLDFAKCGKGKATRECCVAKHERDCRLLQIDELQLPATTSMLGLKNRAAAHRGADRRPHGG